MENPNSLVAKFIKPMLGDPFWGFYGFLFGILVFRMMLIRNSSTAREINFQVHVCRQQNIRKTTTIKDPFFLIIRNSEYQEAKTISPVYKPTTTTTTTKDQLPSVGN